MFRYPDKPSSQLARAGLADLPKLYIAELKLDGWRCVIESRAGRDRTAEDLTSGLAVP